MSNFPQIGQHRAEVQTAGVALEVDPLSTQSKAKTGMNAIVARIKLFNTFVDSRWEDLTRDTWATTAYRDFSAGLVTALTAIPMAMGFAMAMGLRPEQGIIAGALACAVGRTWGGSKYQVYGPTAAFIPVIAGLISKYGEAGGGTLQQAHGFLVLVSIISGIILMVMGVFGLGKYIVRLVPNSIIVGFTAGIAVAIALTNLESILGLEDLKDLIREGGNIEGGLWHNIQTTYSNLGKINVWSLILGLLTFLLTKILLRISILIPGPLVSVGIATLMAATVFADKGIILVRNVYGSIPNNFFVFTSPVLPTMTNGVLVDILYFVSAIVFVSGVESILCSSMADRLADNKKTLFNPDKELWGQGLVQILVPLVNGFPCTGALARTATSIKAGAITPLAGYFKAALKLAIAYFIAGYLEMVPMACIGGILLWVASNMIKPKEILEVLEHNRFHAFLMVYTAVMVPLTDFLTGVLSALILYGVLYKFLDKSIKHAEEPVSPQVAIPALNAVQAFDFNKVVIPLKHDDTEADLIRYVAEQAKRGIGKEFHFVHIADLSKSEFNSSTLSKLNQNLQDYVRPLFGNIEPHLKMHFEVIAGHHVIDALLTYLISQKVDLCILGHHKPFASHRAIGAHLAMLSPCSIWVVPDKSKPEINNVLAPIDFSSQSSRSLATAVKIAKTADSKVNALHIYFDESSVRYEEHVEKIRHNEENALNSFLKNMSTNGVAVKGVFEESTMPGKEIVRQAKLLDSNLIVMGTRGRSKAAAIVMGSVASQVLAEAEIPVIAVHDGESMRLKDAIIASKFWEHHEPKAG